MEAALVVLKQVIIMFVLVFVGYILFRTGKITKEGNRTLVNLLLYVSIPCTIVNSIITERTAEKLSAFAISSVAGAVIIVGGIAIASLCFKKDAIAAFAASYPNAGFIGIPLITSVLGAQAVFYVAPLIAIENMMQWTHGVSVLTGQKSSLKPKAVLTAPFMIAIVIGLIIFISNIKLPALITNTLSQVAGINTILAMFTIGTYFAEVDIKKMAARGQNYLICLVRLILIPFVFMLIMKLLPDKLSEMRSALFIAAACPVGANVAVYARIHGRDYAYAVETIVITTVLSVITVPLMVLLSKYIW